MALLRRSWFPPGESIAMHHYHVLESSVSFIRIVEAQLYQPKLRVRNKFGYQNSYDTNRQPVFLWHFSGAGFIEEIRKVIINVWQEESSYVGWGYDYLVSGSIYFTLPPKKNKIIWSLWMLHVFVCFESSCKEKIDKFK